MQTPSANTYANQNFKPTPNPLIFVIVYKKSTNKGFISFIYKKRVPEKKYSLKNIKINYNPDVDSQLLLFAIAYNVRKCSYTVWFSLENALILQYSVTSVSKILSSKHK